MRLVPLFVLAMAASPGMPLYPATRINCPSTEQFNTPSEVATPLSIRLKGFPPGRVVACGNAMLLPAVVPSVLNRSKNTGVAALLNAAVPAPTRSTTKLPGTKSADAVLAEKSAVDKTVPIRSPEDDNLLPAMEQHNEGNARPKRITDDSRLIKNVLNCFHYQRLNPAKPNPANIPKRAQPPARRKTEASTERR